MKNIKTKQEFLFESFNGMCPKSNLGIGKFLINYYRGKSEPYSGTIYRIHYEGHSSYIAFEIHKHTSKEMSRGIDDSEIIGTEDFKGDADTDWCFEVVDENIIKKLIVRKTTSEIIKFLAELPGSIQGVSDKLEYYNSASPKKLSQDYINQSGGSLRVLVEIYDENNNKVYDPLMDFPGDFGGRKPVKFN